MQEHAIHRLDEFLSHLAVRQPHLLSLLPEEERPDSGMRLQDWVLSLPHRRLMEICTAWVLASMQRLKDSSPLTNVLFRGCLHFGGEFDIEDAAAVAVGEVMPAHHPRSEEIRGALLRAARLGILIHLRREDRFCIPFPVRLSYEGVDYLEPLERDTIRIRLVRHFGSLARALACAPEVGNPRHWRFPNLLTAYETSVELMEEWLGFDHGEWMDDPGQVTEVPGELAIPMMEFGRLLGRSLVLRRSPSSGRLLAASVAAAHSLADPLGEAEIREIMGQYQLRRGEFQGAMETYAASERLRQEANDHSGAVVARCAIALALREVGKVDDSINAFLKASRYAAEKGLDERRIDATNCAARLLLRTTNPDRAAEVLSELIEDLGTEGRRFPAYTEVLVLYAVSLCQTREQDAAKRWFYTALALARQFTHRPAEASACQGLGRLYMEEGNVAESVKWLRRARASFAEQSDYRGLAETYMNLRSALQHSVGENHAESLLIKAVKAAEKSKDMSLLAEALGQQGELVLTRPDPFAAIALFHRQIDALRFTDNLQALGRACMRVARLHFQLGAALAAASSALRAQGVARLAEDSALVFEADAFVRSLQPHLQPGQFEFLVDQITEELEEGRLFRRPPR